MAGVDHETRELVWPFYKAWPAARIRARAASRERMRTSQAESLLESHFVDKNRYCVSLASDVARKVAHRSCCNYLLSPIDLSVPSSELSLDASVIASMLYPSELRIARKQCGEVVALVAQFGLRRCSGIRYGSHHGNRYCLEIN